MLQSQKIISCLLCIAILLGTMLTITCLAVDSESSVGGEIVDSSQPEEESSEESSSNPEEESSEGEYEEESSMLEESSEESSEETVESSEESVVQQDSGNNYYYAGDESYAPYTGSRVVKNPNIVEDEPNKDKKVVNKNIKDWSDVARRWIFLPILFTILSLGALIWFNLYVKKQNAEWVSSNSDVENKAKTHNRRNFNRPKH